MTDPAPILLVANFADRVGGGEESLLTLVRGLDRLCYLPFVLVPGEGEIARALRDLKIPVKALALPPLRPWTVVAALRAHRQLRSLLAAWHIELVHAHGSRGALYAGLATRRLRIPVVWHARIADRDPMLDPLLLALSARVIAISQAVKDRFPRSRHAEKVRVVYNGIDAEYWKPMEGAAPLHAVPTILLVGRLSPEKGQATLVRAAPLVIERIPTARFVLLGADSKGEADRLRRLAQELSVSEAVEFRSWMADPRPAFQEADVVVLPSRSEGFGRVLVEAACLGKPVVASRVGGIPEVVQDGQTGYLVPPDDPEALSERLLTLLGDRELRLRMGAAGRSHALARFAIQRHVEGVAAVYADALASNHFHAPSPNAICS